MRTRWGDEIPDEYDARREGLRSRCYDRNPYDDFGVSRQEEEAHRAWQRGHDEACEKRRGEERREEERREERARERREEEEAYERAQYLAWLRNEDEAE